MTQPHTLAAPVTIQITTDPVIIQQLAYATWQPTYQTILAQEQIEYMLQTLYSIEALQQQMQEGQEFLLLYAGKTPAAFAAYSLQDAASNLYKLNKLYIHPEFQGKGFGKMLLEEVKRNAKAKEGKILELNVHRQNPALQFYLKHGFEIFQKKDIPFGRFTLNDYIMRLNLSE